jgi:hypothetical protein
MFAAAITFFQANRSTTRLLLRSVTPAGLSTIRDSVALPSSETLRSLKKPRGVSWAVLAANAAAQGLLAVGVLAALYAGYLVPEFRVTASQMTAIVNGFATILLFALIDPQISALTDDVVDGSVSDLSPRYDLGVIEQAGRHAAGTSAACASSSGDSLGCRLDLE